MQGRIELAGVGKRFGSGPVILDELALDVAPGEIVSLVGPSGCGKSTLLRLLAGLDHPDGGALRVNGRAVSRPDRAVGFVFQEPRLLPWLTVEQKVAFGLDPTAASTRALVADLLAQVQLGEAAALYPRQLSGGMAQRVSLARALATRPAVLLLDEPFSAVDAFTRMHLQELLLALWARTRSTMVVVTHEIDEALYLGDRVAVLSERPARVTEVLSVAAERPRDRRDPRLATLRVHLLETLRLAGRAAARPPG